MFRNIRFILSLTALCSLFLGSSGNEAYAQCNAGVDSIPFPFWVCAPQAVTLNTTSSTGTITGYSWDFGDGSPVITTANTTHTYSAVTSDTTYTLTLSITCSTGPGSDDTSITVNVFAPPTVLFYIDTAAVCDFTDTVCFDNQSETGVGFTYDWEFGDLATCSPSCFEPCHSYTSDGIYNVSLTVTDDNFCQDSFAAVVNTNFSLVPVVTLSSSAANDTICIGDSIQFTASAGGYILQPVTYIFYNDTVIVQSDTASTYSTAGLTDGDSISVQMVNASGCRSDTSNTVVTTVLSLPSVGITSSDTFVCEGASISFTATPSGLGSYLFYDGTTLLQNSSNTTYSTDSLQGGNTVFVVGINANGCVSPPSSSLSTAIMLTPSPYIDSSIIGAGICRGDSLTLYVLDSTVTGGTYVWSTGGTADSIIIGPLSSTTYSVLMMLGGCSSTDSLAVFVDSLLPVANAGIDTVLCQGKDVTLSTSGGILYYWSPSADLSCAACQSPTASPLVTTTYQVTVTNIICFDTDDIIVTVEACSVGSIPQVLTPNGDGVNDLWKIPNIDNFPDNKITIFNGWGNIVFNTNGYDNTANYWDGKSTSGQDLSDGTYYYVLDLGTETEPLTGYVTIYK